MILLIWFLLGFGTFVACCWYESRGSETFEFTWNDVFNLVLFLLLGGVGFFVAVCSFLMRFLDTNGDKALFSIKRKK